MELSLNPYHRTVQDGILVHEKRLGNKGDKGEVNPIHINSKFKHNIRYLPDGHFKSKFGKTRVYEVLDDELNDDNLIIADIVQAFLTENVSLIQFVVPNAKAQNKVNELAVTIYDRLVQMGISQKDLREVRTMAISRDVATDKEAVANYLSESTRERRMMQDTVDLVIVGAFFGRGRGEGKYGAFLLAAYDSNNDVFGTMCKSGSGFFDEDLNKLPKVLEKYRIDHKHPRVDSKIDADVWFVPGLVLEMIGSDIILNPMHTCGMNIIKRGKGLSLRFPRFTGKYRLEKSPEDSTTTVEVVEMYRSLNHLDTRRE